MNLELPFPKVDPAQLDELLNHVERAVDGAFLAEVDAALERLLVGEPHEDAAAA